MASAPSNVARPGPRRSAIHAGRLGAAFMLLVCLAGIAESCPNCKDGIAATGSAEAAAMARGYALSILIMLAMPFTLVGSFGLYVWREMRRLDREGPKSPDGMASPVAMASRDGRPPEAAAAGPIDGAAPALDQTSWDRPIPPT